MTWKHHVSATVNGDDVEFLCETEQTLLDVLRDELHLTGSKEGCGSGDCGACSVTLDGRLVCACLVLGVEVSGRQVETIEGMAEGDELHPLQRKFHEHAALVPVETGFVRDEPDVAAHLTNDRLVINLGLGRDLAADADDVALDEGLAGDATGFVLR